MSLIFTVPHSGEWIPDPAVWLKEIPLEILLTDIDRFVDQLYAPVAKELEIPMIRAKFHRYAADLNRFPEDSDFHWKKTTKGVDLLKDDVSEVIHDELVEKIYNPFHAEIQRLVSGLDHPIYHFDCHSMPSRGETYHKDAGQERPEIVLSDVQGKSCEPRMLEITKRAFEKAGFQVSINWPYQGGRITQRYGQPASGHHTLQIEMNRKLYMDEESREKRTPEFEQIQKRLAGVFQEIVAALHGFKL